MELSKVEQIERAIADLAPTEIQELYAWLDENYPQPIDVCIESDLDAGRLDSLINRALDGEKNGRVRPF